MTEIGPEFEKMTTKPEDDYFKKLLAASAKHQEILNMIMQKISADKKTKIETIINFSKSNEQTITKYKNKKATRWGQEGY